MEYLKYIGEFEITSEKIDNYVPWWVPFIGVIGFFGALSWMFLRIYTFFGGFIPSEWGLGITVVFGVSIFLFFAPAAYYNNICGISIELKGTYTHEITQFALSSNADRDAKKIKNVVDKYTKLAHKLDTKQKEKDAYEKKLKQECCIRYNDVIQKVKTE